MLVSKVKDKTFSDTQLNDEKVSKWAFQWKMFFDPDPSKQAIEIYFAHKRDNKSYPSFMLNYTKVPPSTCQKHLGLILISKPDFNDYIGNKIIGIMKRFSLIVSRKSLPTICKSFVRPNLDYADIIYNKPFNESFKRNGMVQYQATLVIAVTIKGTSRDRLYQELGL